MPESGRLLDSWRDERNSAALYETLASLESNPKLAEIYRRLSAEERHHADTWAERLSAEGVKVPAFRPSWRTRMLIRLAHRFGIGLVLPSVATLEDIGGHGYVETNEASAGKMAATERSHARLLRRITRASGGLEGAVVAQLEGRHRAAGGNALRAAVLGANDIRDRAAAVETLSREELGIDPKELGGSAWEAAATSFLLFAAGALIPVVPYMFAAGTHAAILSLVCSAAGLFTIGAGITLFTGRPVLTSGLRQVMFGLAAAAATFVIGRLIGVSLGG